MKVELRHWKDGWSEPLPTGEASVVLCFGTTGLLDDAQPLTDLHNAYPDAVHAGCSSAGEILGEDIHDDSLTAAIIHFDSIVARGASASISDPSQSQSVGQQLAKELLAQRDDLAHVFLLSDGLGVNGSELARGVQDPLAADVVVTGGLAGDGSRFERTWVFDGESARSGVVRAVGLYGSALSVGHGSHGGWNPFGVQRKVTRSEGNVLFELDGQPALQLYKEYLGARAAELPASGLLFPLSLQHGDRKDIVRTILAVDEEAQSMTFAGDIPQGCTVRLMRADYESLVDAAGKAAASSDTGSPVLALAVSCVGRRLVLGERTEEEVEEILDRLPPGSSLTGFYSYGELSPSGDGSACDLHNQTMTLTTWRESSI